MLELLLIAASATGQFGVSITIVRPEPVPVQEVTVTERIGSWEVKRKFSFDDCAGRMTVTKKEENESGAPVYQATCTL